MIDHIAYATDGNYAPHVATSIRSVIANDVSESLRFTVIGMNVAKRTKERLFRSTTGNASMNWIDSRDLDSNSLPVKFHLTSAAYLRLLLPRYVAENFVYLDADVIACRDIAPLLDVDVSEHIMAAVENPGFSDHARLNMSESTPYFNTGVLVVNASRWNAAGVTERALDFALNNPSSIEFADQCAINAVIGQSVMALHPQFNVMHHFYQSPVSARTFGGGEVAEAVRHPLLLHYSGSSKPWQLRNNHPLNEMYWRHRRWHPCDRLTKVARFLFNHARSMRNRLREASS